ncbi:MAG: RidA family protein [Bacteroidales bacterium]|nr:RidA family protein [Bacteroidales bacterium]
MNKLAVNPKELFNSTQYGFSQIVVCDPGKLVFISGQVAWDSNLNIIGKNDLKIQTQKSIENLKIAMESLGGTLDNIVMLRIYKVDYKKEDGTVINELLKENFGTVAPPASTWVSVKGLANEGFLIEIEAQAVL